MVIRSIFHQMDRDICGAVLAGERHDLMPARLDKRQSLLREDRVSNAAAVTGGRATPFWKILVLMVTYFQS